MNMMKKVAKKVFDATVTLALTLVIGAVAIRYASGAWPDPEADLGMLRILNGGVVTWKIGANGDNNLSVIDNVTAGGAVNKFYPGAGGLGLRSRTNTQLQTDVPGAAGAIVYNSDQKTVCVATGTGAGAWVYISTTNTKAFPISCNG